PTLSRVLDHLTTPRPAPPDPGGPPDRPPAPPERVTDDADDADDDLSGTTDRSAALAARLSAELAREETAATAARATATASAAPTGTAAVTPAGTGPSDSASAWDDRALPLFPLQPPRTARELLSDHITAMVCCAAMDTAGAAPGLDWLDGPVLLVGGARGADLSDDALSLIE